MKTIFERLKSIVEHAAFPWLTAYRNDFYECDRDYLQLTAAPGSRYIWVVRASGSHLVRLGIHCRQHAEIEAVLETTSAKDLQLYVVDENSVKEIDVKGATALLRKYDYRIEGSWVLKGDFPIASMNITLTGWGPHGERPKGKVEYFHPAPYLSLESLVALRILAECEVCEQSHSLFTPTESVTLDGEDLRQMISQQQQAQGLWPTESQEKEKQLTLV